MPVKLLTSGGGGVNLVPSSSIASDQTMYLPTSGTSGGTVLCTDSTGGTANGVLYLNGSKQVTSGSGLVFDSSGNLGIGTSSPSTYNPNASYNKITSVVKSDQAVTLGSYYQNGVAQTGFIRASNGANTVLTDMQYDAYTHRFLTGSGVATSTERMRIDSSGNLLVGLTGSNLGGKLEVAGAVSGSSTARYPYIGSSTGTAVVIDGSGYFRASSSSRRYKENIEPIDVGLSEVLKMEPVKYDLKENGTAQVGFVAEDFPEPRLVNYSMVDPEDPSKGEQVESVNYANLTAILVKAIQEQQAIIESLTQRIEALEYTK